MKVLIAEDNELVRGAAVEYLTRDGHTVLEATRGYEAVKMAREHRPEVIILDGLMPDMHGFEIARFIRGLADSYEPRIILMTAIHKGSQDRSEAKLRYGIDHYLIKPLTYAGVRSAVVGDDADLTFHVDEAAVAQFG